MECWCWNTWHPKVWPRLHEQSRQKDDPNVGLVYGLVYLSWIIKSPQFRWLTSEHRQPSHPKHRRVKVRLERLEKRCETMVDTPWSSLPRFYHWPRSNERSDGHDGPLEWVAKYSGNLMGWTWTMVSELSHKHQSIIKWMSLLLQSLKPIRRHVHFCWMHLLFFLSYIVGCITICSIMHVNIEHPLYNFIQVSCMFNPTQVSCMFNPTQSLMYVQSHPLSKMGISYNKYNELYMFTSKLSHPILMFRGRRRREAEAAPGALRGRHRHRQRRAGSP